MAPQINVKDYETNSMYQNITFIDQKIGLQSISLIQGQNLISYDFPLKN